MDSYTVSERLGVTLYSQKAIKHTVQELEDAEKRGFFYQAEAKSIFDNSSGLKSLEKEPFSAKKQMILDEAQTFSEKQAFVRALTKKADFKVSSDCKV